VGVASLPLAQCLICIAPIPSGGTTIRAISAAFCERHGIEFLLLPPVSCTAGSDVARDERRLRSGKIPCSKCEHGARLLRKRTQESASPLLGPIRGSCRLGRVRRRGPSRGLRRMGSGLDETGARCLARSRPPAPRRPAEIRPLCV